MVLITEKVLTYDHSVVPQEEPWDCGPASTQVVLNGRGIVKSEADLISEIGTTVNGTNYVGLIENVLDQLVPAAEYTSVYLENDPPSADQVEALWKNIVASIDAGYGVVMNWEAPPSNYPVGVKGSVSPSYSGGEVLHYVAAMGYDDTPGARAVWIADSGFNPFGYWIGFDQCASLIPPKGYCYASAPQVGIPAAPMAPEIPVAAPPEVPSPVAEPAAPAAAETPVGVDVYTLYADVSEWQSPVNSDYPYSVLCFRSNDGTYRDKNWSRNYGWAINASNSGALEFFIVYFVWRQNWQDTVNTLKAQVGAPHPKMVVMIDVESWGGQISGDQSSGINGAYSAVASWLGDPQRVIGYGNVGDLNGLWPTKPAGIRLVLAGYGSNPDYPGKIAHQYTNGTGYGNGLPEGAAPFGNCDMNSADGLSAADFAAACGVGAATTTENDEGVFMALTSDEQDELLAKVRYLFDQVGPGFDVWGADGDLGLDAAGQRRTLRNGVAATMKTVGVKDG